MDEQRTPLSEEQADSSQVRTTERTTSAMHARTWAIAATREPAAYGIPELPAWCRLDPDGAGIAFADDGCTAPFISAQQPMTVRR